MTFKIEKLHYKGALVWVNRDGRKVNVLAGWAACCSGPRAIKVKERGNHTMNPAEVTCAQCLARMARAAEYKGEL